MSEYESKETEREQAYDLFMKTYLDEQSAFPVIVEKDKVQALTQSEVAPASPRTSYRRHIRASRGIF